MTFHFAEPELNGFGVTIWTPGLTRSSQVLMCFGLPSRNANTTTESATMPLYVCCFCQFGCDEAGVDQRVHVAPVERKTTSALRPAATARAWSPEAP